MSSPPILCPGRIPLLENHPLFISSANRGGRGSAMILWRRSLRSYLGVLFGDFPKASSGVSLTEIPISVSLPRSPSDLAKSFAARPDGVPRQELPQSRGTAPFFSATYHPNGQGNPGPALEKDSSSAPASERNVERTKLFPARQVALSSPLLFEQSLEQKLKR